MAPHLQCKTVLALGQTHRDPDVVVPVLTNALSDPEFSVRIYALIALKRFGPDAKLAVPALLHYYQTDFTTRSSDALKAIDPEATARAGVK